MRTTRKPKQLLLIVLAFGSGFLEGPGVAGEAGDTAEVIEQLRRRIEELERKVKALEGSNSFPTVVADGQAKDQLEALDQKVRVMERNAELDKEAAEGRAKETPKITIGERGFSFASGDGAFGLQLRGVLQVDSRTFFNDSGTAGNDGLLLRRARPILQGTVFRDLDFLFVPDFGGSGSPQIFDAYLNYRYSPALQLQAGKFKSPIGLEQLVADQDLIFNERALPTDLVPNRDIGFALHGDLFDGGISYTAGIFNGVGDGRNSSNVDFEDNKAFEGRLFFQPFKSVPIAPLQGLGFGVSGSYEASQAPNTAGLPATTGGSLPGYVTDGQQQFFAYNPADRAVVVADGQHWRISPQGYYYYGPFSLLGEYVISDQEVGRTVTAPLASARLQHSAWQIAGGWVLTGENAAYKGGVVPRRSFNPRAGGWGAWQVVARYAELSIDDKAFPLFSDPNTSARAAAAWAVGLNWYLNRNVSVKASFSHTHFNGGGGPGTSAPGAVTRKDENVFFTRMQLAF